MPRSHAAEGQQSEQDVQQDQAEARDALPGEVLSLMSVLRPGDAQPLARILATYPQYREEILRKAATLVGNETVSAAVHAGSVPAMQAPAAPSADQGPPDPSAVATGMQQVQDEKKGPDAVATQGPQDAVHTFASDVKNDQQDVVATAATPQLYRAPDPNSWEDSVQLQVRTAENAKDLSQILKMHPALRQQIVDEAAKSLSPDEIARAVRMADAPAGGAAEEKDQTPPPQPAQGEPQPGDAAPGMTAADPETQAAWIGQARGYNAAHADYADEFVAIVGPSVLDDQAILDPTKVAQWQKQNGLEADGKVGPHTVGAARQMKPRPDATQAAQDALPDDDVRKEAV